MLKIEVKSVKGVNKMKEKKINSVKLFVGGLLLSVVVLNLIGGVIIKKYAIEEQKQIEAEHYAISNKLGKNMFKRDKVDEENKGNVASVPVMLPTGKTKDGFTFDYDMINKNNVREGDHITLYDGEKPYTLKVINYSHKGNNLHGYVARKINENGKKSSAIIGENDLASEATIIFLTEEGKVVHAVVKDGKGVAVVKNRKKKKQ